MRKNSYKTRIALLSVLLAFLIFFFCFAAAVEVLNVTVEISMRTLPSYEREDISALVLKTEFTDEEYQNLYLQTGLGKSAIDELVGKPDKLRAFQDTLFYEGKLLHGEKRFPTFHDTMDEGVVFPLAPLHNGDVVLTSSCHTFGWRHGHAALVVNADYLYSIESFSPGTKSGYGKLEWFQSCPNFMVLRLKEEYRYIADPEKIALAAESTLTGLDYDVTVGVFSPKDQCKNGRKPQKTQCAHIVWQAFYNFGIDVDSDAGATVTVRDLSRSPYFEIVQVNGFDPIKLW